MTHDERVYHHEMETLEGIHEHAERIASLEELVLDLLQWDTGPCKECFNYDPCTVSSGCKFWDVARDRARELGVEIDAEESE